MSRVILELCGVKKSYGVDTDIPTEVLHGIDLAINGGELTALIGPSGSGKSTLLNLLGLLDRPTAGSIIIDDVDTTHLDEAELTRVRAHKIGFVFQFHHLLPAFTALENVLLPAQSQSRFQTERMRARARELLEAVGLAAYTDRMANHLSGGQQQRVAVARALMMNPPLLLADEPTGNLDRATADQVFELFRQLLAERGAAALVVTHDPGIATRADRVVSLVDGRIVKDSRN